MTGNENDFDPLIRIEFEKSRSKYFDDALTKARRKSSSSGKAEFIEPKSSESNSYKFSTSDPKSAREIWQVVKNWKSSQMKVEGEGIIPDPNAGIKDIREIEQKQRKEEIIDKIDTSGSSPVVEVRFGPSSSKYADKAVEEARHLSSKNDNTEYQRVKKGVYDNKKAKHMLVTKNATAAYNLYDTVEGWKNSEIWIGGQRATKEKLGSLSRKQTPFSVTLFMWLLVAILFALSFLFAGT